MPTGLTADAGWQIGVSRTLDVPVEHVWQHLTSDEGVASWLGPGARLPEAPGGRIEAHDGSIGELRSRHHQDRLRLRWRPAGWDHDTVVQVTVVASGDRTSLRFHHDHLADAEERTRRRDHWRSVLDRLATELGLD